MVYQNHISDFLRKSVADLAGRSFVVESFVDIEGCFSQGQPDKSARTSPTDAHLLCCGPICPWRKSLNRIGLQCLLEGTRMVSSLTRNQVRCNAVEGSTPLPSALSPYVTMSCVMVFSL
jgi:hypothetical protein